MNTLRVTGGRVLHPDGRVTTADVTIDSDAGTILAERSDVPGQLADCIRTHPSAL